MKILGLILLIGIIVVAYIVLTTEKPPEDLQTAVVNETFDRINEVDDTVNRPVKMSTPVSSLDFSFIGFGPGKSHEGTFDDIKIENLTYDSRGLNAGMVRINVNSVNTSPAILNEHLCSENFFDCKNHKEIIFELEGNKDHKISSDTTLATTVIGKLTFKGITKNISFEVEHSEAGDSFEADFKLNVKEFGFAGLGVNDEVQIKFSAKK